MRKIAIGGMTAALALTLTACNLNADDKPAAAAPSSPTTATATPSNGTNSGRPTASIPPRTPRTQHTPLTQQGGQQISSKWGPLHYVAPGKYAVGHVVFSTSTATRLTIAGGDCPDGTPPPTGSFKCGIDGLDDWAQSSPHNVNVRFSGQLATSITETQ